MIAGTPVRLIVGAVPGGQATLSVALNEASPNAPILEVESDDSAWQAARATNGIQTSGWAVYVDGDLIDLSHFSGSISVTRSYDQQLQTWQFELSLDLPSGVVGSPFDCIGPPTGRREVDVYGVYKLPNGSTKMVPLILGGIADNSLRSARADGSCVESITGVDRGGQFDQELVTLVLPPGHGFPRGRVLRLLAERAGETQFNLHDGNTMYKELQLVDGDWLAVATEQQEVENRRVLWNVDAELSNPKVGRPRDDEPDAFDLDETDFLRVSEVGVGHKAYVLTDVTLTGIQQVVSDGGACALDPQTPVDRISEAVYAPAVQPYKATAEDTIGASGLSPETASRRVVGIARFQQVLRCGTLVYERSTRWAYHNPLATRLEWDSVDREWDLIIGRFLPDNDVTAMGEAHAFGKERFTVVEDSEAWHYYMQQGFTYPAGASNERYDHLRGPYPYDINTTTGEWEGAFVGFYLGSITRTSAYDYVAKAVRERDTSLPPPYDLFDELDPITGTVLIGTDGVDTAPTLPFESSYASGALGSVSTGQALIPTAETILHVYGDTERKKTQEVTLTFGWGRSEAFPGAYQYGDGTESNDPAETWQETARAVTVYVSLQGGGESLHSKRTEFYVLGVFDRSENEPSISGDRPPVPMLPTNDQNEAAYASEEELAEFAKYARRMDSRPIKVQVTADGLLTCHFPGLLKTDVPWAENEDELAEVGLNLIDESLAAPVTFTVLGNFFLRETQVGRAYYKRLGLADPSDSTRGHRVRLRSVSHSGPTSGPVLTACEALLYGGSR